jgi:mRNA interferase RelE/StbE
MEYTVRLAKDATEYLSRLPKKFQRQVARKIDALRTNPHPPQSKKLEENIYRVRSGDYRIIYSVRKKEILVLVLKIGDRKEVYRNLSTLSK